MPRFDVAFFAKPPYPSAIFNGIEAADKEGAMDKVLKIVKKQNKKVECKRIDAEPTAWPEDLYDFDGRGGVIRKAGK
jgi:hypothetical protein